MLGVGGGIVFIPVIQEVLRIHGIQDDFVAYTLANSLMLVFIVGISGTLKQMQLGNTHLFSALVTGVSAIISSFAITLLINEYHWIDQRVFNTIFATLLIVTAIRMSFSDKKENPGSAGIVIPDAKKFVPAGLFAGTITALSGLGGGIIMVPYFNKVLKLPIRFSTGLSLSVIPVIALPLLVYYSVVKPSEVVYKGYQTGYIIWPVILPIVIAAIFASRYGIKFSQKLPPRVIHWIFIGFIVITLGKMFLFSEF